MAKFSVATAAPSLLVLVMVLLLFDFERCGDVPRYMYVGQDVVEFYWTYWTERGTAAKILWTTHDSER